MEAEIEEQPARLGSSIYDFSFLKEQHYQCVVFIARGSSDHAALYGRYLVETKLEIPALLAAPSVLTRFGKHVRYPRCLAIGISQSGAAPDVAEMIDALRSQGHDTIGITNTADSRLTRCAEHTVLLNAGPERSVAATKTYTTSLLAMYQLVNQLGGSLPEPALPRQEWLSVARSAAKEHAVILFSSRPLFALGRGYDFSSAQEAALKLMECALLPCLAYSSADFEHGPKALASKGSAAIVFGEAQGRLVDQGAQVLRAPEPPSHVADEAKPIWQAVYSQFLALECARLAGLDPDHPQFLSKVTETL